MRKDMEVMVRKVKGSGLIEGWEKRCTRKNEGDEDEDNRKKQGRRQGRIIENTAT